MTQLGVVPLLGRPKTDRSMPALVWDGIFDHQ